MLSCKPLPRVLEIHAVSPVSLVFGALSRLFKTIIDRGDVYNFTLFMSSITL